MTTTTHPPVSEAVLLTKAIIKARLTVERTTADLAVAYADAEAARTRLGLLEFEYKALTDPEGRALVQAIHDRKAQG